MSRVTKEIKAKAEVYYGDETCREKFVSLLEEKVENSEASNLNTRERNSFYILSFRSVWLVIFKFFYLVLSWYQSPLDSGSCLSWLPLISQLIKNLTGVKAKEFLIWIALTDIYVDQSSSITFKTNLVGLSKSFPMSVVNV
uniref:Uncharacterized protein n=1 Tax=Gossypium raimondii TaxID=29730 RepID=A0A0D2VPI5_GOSRA|nr:hypothetical protein B456_011G203200 [Gossypium raimondii]